VGAARIAYFTAGTVGAGHLARGIAIERALARAESTATFALIGPSTTLRLAHRASYHAVAMDPAELAHPERARQSELARTLRELAPDVLLVDLFWAPLRHLLPLPGCEAWLLLRRTPPVWFVGPKGLPFEPSLFSRILGIEPGLEAPRLDATLPPIVTVNHDELRPKGALREHLRVLDPQPLQVIHQAGAPDDWRKLLEVRPERPVHVLTPGPPGDDVGVRYGVHLHDGQALFPLAAWLSDADAIACGAGYNAFWEARWLGHAKRTTFVPFVRTIDDQAWRLRTCWDHTPVENGADVLARWLR
jgi:hypothetical protein